jgi:molybdopterin/thiamine biosynthesis adenylyltransferase
MQKFKVLSSKKQRKADKSVRLLFPEPSYQRMLAAFSEAESSSREGYAVAQCGYRVDGARKYWTYMVRSLHVPAKEDLFEQSSITVTPRADFIEAILSEASEKNNAIVEVHTHVGSAQPNFSWLDIENGLENGRFLRSCGLRFAMAVVGRDGFSLCEYDADHDAIQMPESARISVMGRCGLNDAIVHRSISSCEILSKVGPEGMRVAIGGLDGVGFGVLYMLARQGVNNFLLLDDGVVDENSSGALPYALKAGRRRTRAAHGLLKKISKDIRISHIGDIGREAMGALKECDVIFSCGADEALAAVLNEASLKYFIPLIEARTLLKNDATYGRVRVFMPSITGCSRCFDDAVANALGPSTVIVNGVVASLAVQEFMGIAGGDGPAARAYDHIEYDPGTQAIERRSAGRDAICPLCGKNGILGAGDVRKTILRRSR